MNAKVLTIIEKCMRRSGQRLHIFLSGGGLRVASFGTTSRQGCRFYGEGTTLKEGLRILSEDIASGSPRAYRDVYGPIEPHYYTGLASAESPLEADLLNRCTIDAMRVVDCANGMKRGILVRVSGPRHVEIPEDVKTAALAGETVEFKDERGLTYRVSPDNEFLDGTPSATAVCLDAPDAPWYYMASKQAIAPTLAQALSDVSAMPFIAWE